MGYEVHRSFETPPDNTQVWRYLSVKKFRSLISDSKLYFARADTLSDTREGEMPKSAFGGKDRLAAAHPGDPVHSLMAYIDRTSKIARLGMFVSCWHINECESAAMWDNYGSDGVAITTTVGKLKKFLATEQAFHIGVVEYDNFDTHRFGKGKKDAIDNFLLKEEIFEYERELRIAIIRPCMTADSADRTEKLVDGNFVDIDVPLLLDGVYISPTATGCIVNEVSSILREYLGGVLKVTKSELSDPKV